MIDHQCMPKNFEDGLEKVQKIRKKERSRDEDDGSAGKMSVFDADGIDFFGVSTVPSYAERAKGVPQVTVGQVETLFMLGADAVLQGEFIEKSRLPATFEELRSLWSAGKRIFQESVEMIRAYSTALQPHINDLATSPFFTDDPERAEKMMSKAIDVFVMRERIYRLQIAMEAVAQALYDKRPFATAQKPEKLVYDVRLDDDVRLLVDHARALTDERARCARSIPEESRAKHWWYTEPSTMPAEEIFVQNTEVSRLLLRLAEWYDREWRPYVLSSRRGGGQKPPCILLTKEEILLLREDEYGQRVLTFLADRDEVFDAAFREATMPSDEDFNRAIAESKAIDIRGHGDGVFQENASSSDDDM